MERSDASSLQGTRSSLAKTLLLILLVDFVQGIVLLRVLMFFTGEHSETRTSHTLCSGVQNSIPLEPTSVGSSDGQCLCMSTLE